MRIISIDPSLTNTAFVYLKKEPNGELLPIDYVLSTQKKSSDKKKLVMQDRIDRIEGHFNTLEKFVATHSPDIITAEVSSGSQSSSAAISVGFSLSLIARCRQLTKTETCQPREVKKQAKVDTSNKDEVISYVEGKYPNFLPRKKDGSINKGQAEHIADAIVIAETVLKNV